jgi:KDO2-lipid IV(A) lauroyltransferase
MSRVVPQMHRQRDLVARHQRRAHGPGLAGPGLTDRELSRSVDAAFAWYGRYWGESFRLPRMSFERIDAGMSWSGFVHLEKAIEDGRGVILALPHLGGWEWGGFWLVQQRRPVTVVVEALEPPELFEWFAGFRRGLGMEIVPVGPQAGSAVVRALKAGHVVCLLCDRNVSDGGGVEVEFFGERTTLPGGPATLAMRTGAPLLPAAVYFTDRHSGHLGLVRPPISANRTGSFRTDVQRITQALACELEQLIRREPTQWHLLQPNWPSDYERS